MQLIEIPDSVLHHMAGLTSDEQSIEEMNRVKAEAEALMAEMRERFGDWVAEQ